MFSHKKNKIKYGNRNSIEPKTIIGMRELPIGK